MRKLALLVWALPVLAAFPLLCAAQAQFGDWVASKSNNILEAYTAIESGSQFGILCMEKCVWYLDAQTKCVEHHEYPVLINAEAGADYLSMRCFTLQYEGRTRYVYIFEEFDKIKNAASLGAQIGFAMPLEGSKFTVSRFSLSGYQGALSALSRLRGHDVKFRDSTM